MPNVELFSHVSGSVITLKQPKSYVIPLRNEVHEVNRLLTLSFCESNLLRIRQVEPSVERGMGSDA